ncbi:MAG: patatin [Deltaproteobacteria bacterium]|nr:patatin [Deltaproteobacteria bacterium]HCH63354.1 patatin [Deltaproteobacteria bacterium]
MDAPDLLARRAPFDRMEAGLVRAHLSAPDQLAPALLDGLRFVLSMSRLGTVRNDRGEDLDISDALARFRWRVGGRLGPILEQERPDLWAAVRELPTLLKAARTVRAQVVQQFDVSPEVLGAEVCERQLVIVSGGGGGSGYGFAGAFRLIHRHNLQPSLLAGTSMGSLISMFRARHRQFDAAKMVAAARQLSWPTVFRVLEMESRYGIPATLRLYLRTALGGLFTLPDGRMSTFRDLEIPLLVCVTGVTVDGLRHDLGYYEHFLDDAVRPGVVFRHSKLQRLTSILSLWTEFLTTPNAIREIIFGGDELTMDTDVLDAAGFSSAVTGVIHYDVIRDDPRMRRLLDRLYAEKGITRLTEGGLVNNVPARPAWEHAMSGKLGRRNPFVLALDCFAPLKRSFAWYPLQQVVRPNVNANLPYAHHYFAMRRRLSPVNLVPPVEQVVQAMDWTADELSPDMPFVAEMCRTLAPLPDAQAAAVRGVALGDS